MDYSNNLRTSKGTTIWDVLPIIGIGIVIVLFNRIYCKSSSKVPWITIVTLLILFKVISIEQCTYEFANPYIWTILLLSSLLHCTLLSFVPEHYNNNNNPTANSSNNSTAVMCEWYFDSFVETITNVQQRLYDPATHTRRSCSSSTTIIRHLAITIYITILSAFIIPGLSPCSSSIIVLIPILQRYARSYHIPIGTILLPLSYAINFGGTWTILGNESNLILNGLLVQYEINKQQQQQQSTQDDTNSTNVHVNCFEILRYTVPITVIALVYLAIFPLKSDETKKFSKAGCHNNSSLPNQGTQTKTVVTTSPSSDASVEDVANSSNSSEEEPDEEDDSMLLLLQAQVPSWSPVVGRTIKRSGLRDTGGIYLVSVKRAATGNVHRAVSVDFVINVHDILYFTASVEEFTQFCEEHGLLEIRSSNTTNNNNNSVGGGGGVASNSNTNASSSAESATCDTSGAIPMDVSSSTSTLGLTLESLLQSSDDDRIQYIHRMSDIIRGIETGEDEENFLQHQYHNNSNKTSSLVPTAEEDAPSRIIVTVDHDLIAIAIDTRDRAALLLDIAAQLHSLNFQLHHSEAAVTGNRSLSIWRCEPDCDIFLDNTNDEDDNNLNTDTSSSIKQPDISEIWTSLMPILSPSSSHHQPQFGVGPSAVSMQLDPELDSQEQPLQLETTEATKEEEAKTKTERTTGTTTGSAPTATNSGHRRRLVQAIVASGNSPFIGKTVKELMFRTRYGAAVVSIYRDGQRLTKEHPGLIPLLAGDLLLLEVGTSFSAVNCKKSLQRNKVILLLADSSASHQRDGESKGDGLETATSSLRLSKVTLSLLLITGMNLLTMTGLIHPFVAVVSCTIFMTSQTIVNENELRDAMDWDKYVTIASASAISSAIEQSGLANIVSVLLINSISSIPSVVQTSILFSLFYQTSWWLSHSITNHNNAASAALMFPIAKEVSELLIGQDKIGLQVLLLAIMMGASSSFLTSYNHPTNLLICGPGGYKHSDFLRWGGPLQILTWFVSTVLLVAYSTMSQP